MKVREIFEAKAAALHTATPQQPLTRAIDEMAEFDVGSLVVMADGRMVGMLTFREILKALRAHGSHIDGMTVGEVMIDDPVTVFPEMEINELRQLMIEKRSRYVPVLEGEQLLGVISFLDVAKAVLEEQGLENRMLKRYIKNWPEDKATLD
ncbi:MAG: CBS domain-containing protein [Azonexus sp.]|jgi:CBS domain-containing protein|nr:CBS domain-containing protein [Azonexus sp.]